MTPANLDRTKASFMTPKSPLNSLCPSRTETEESSSINFGGKDQHDPPGQHVADKKMPPNNNNDPKLSVKRYSNFHQSVCMDKIQHNEIAPTFSNRYEIDFYDHTPAHYASSNYLPSMMPSSVSNGNYVFIERNPDTTTYQKQNHYLGQQYNKNMIENPMYWPNKLRNETNLKSRSQRSTRLGYSEISKPKPTSFSHHARQRSTRLGYSDISKPTTTSFSHHSRQISTRLGYSEISKPMPTSFSHHSRQYDEESFKRALESMSRARPIVADDQQQFMHPPQTLYMPLDENAYVELDDRDEDIAFYQDFEMQNPTSIMSELEYDDEIISHDSFEVSYDDVPFDGSTWNTSHVCDEAYLYDDYEMTMSRKTPTEYDVGISPIHEPRTKSFTVPEEVVIVQDFELQSQISSSSDLVSDASLMEPFYDAMDPSCIQERYSQYTYPSEIPFNEDCLHENYGQYSFTSDPNVSPWPPQEFSSHLEDKVSVAEISRGTELIEESKSKAVQIMKAESGPLRRRRTDRIKEPKHARTVAILQSSSTFKKQSIVDSLENSDECPNINVSRRSERMKLVRKNLRSRRTTSMD